MDNKSREKETNFRMIYFNRAIFMIVLFCLVQTNGLMSQIFQVEPFRFCNSPYDEQSPVISPDQKFLYFTIAKHPTNVGGKNDLGDIWYSTWDDGVWSTPVHAGLTLNNEGYNAVLGFSENGDRIFLAGHYERNKTPNSQGFAVATRNEAGWSFPENRSVPYFLNRSNKFSGVITPDESVFLFSAVSYETKGVEDIYVSLKEDGKWKEPVNLGSLINTTLQEFTPSIASDGNTIYFSSNGRGGFGGFDIFKSSRLDDTWTSWSTPENLGPALNSDARELYFRPSTKQNIFFYTTTKNSNGYGDIFTMEIPAVVQTPVDTVLKFSETNKNIQNKKVMVSGRVTNFKDGSFISSLIEFKSDSTYTTRSGVDGYFKIYIPSTKVYSIEVQAKSFVNLSERLDIHTFELSNLEMNFKLQPIEVGTVVNLKSVLFYMGTTSLLEESYPELDVIVDFLTTNPKVEIQLEGHTDNRGDAKKNIILSEQRVDRIKMYLVSKGIGARRIRGKGFGGSRPIAKDESEDSRKLNRRVEFVIVKD